MNPIEGAVGGVADRVRRVADEADRREQASSQLKTDPAVQSVVVTSSGVHVTYKQPDDSKEEKARAANLYPTQLVELARLLGVPPAELLNLSPDEIQAKEDRLQGVQRQRAVELTRTARTGDGFLPLDAQPIELPTSDQMSAAPGGPPAVAGVRASPLATLKLAEGQGTVEA